MHSISRKIIIVVLLVSCLIMSIVFATFSQELKYNATGSIDTTWNIKFTKIEEVSKTSGVTIKIAPSVTNTTATMNVGLTSPGDTITYKITVQNTGTINAVVNSINATDSGNNAIIMRASGIKTGDVLNAGATTTFTVSITYNSSVTSQPNIRTNTLKLQVNYIQYVGQSISSSTDPIVPKSIVQVVSGNLNTVGSEISIGSEHFYIISSDSTKVTMLSKYNLDVNSGTHIYSGTGRQNSNVVGYNSQTGATYGSIAFSNSAYWSSSCSSYPCYVYNSNSNIYTYVNSYKTYLESLGANIYQARIIKYEELTKLGCSADSYGSCSYSWVYSTSYWSGSASHSSGLRLIINRNNGEFVVREYSESNYFGIRPVIEILKSNI